MNGSPLEGAIVTFAPTDNTGHAGVGQTDAKGKYALQTMEGAPGAGTTPGEYIVTISKRGNRSTGRFVEDVGPDGQKFTVEITEGFDAVPVKFTKPETTPFKETVEAGKKNVFNFDVSD